MRDFRSPLAHRDRRQGLPSGSRFAIYAGARPDNDMSTTKPRKKPEDLRSQQWFGRQDRDGFAYRSWVKGKGVPHDQFDGRPGHRHLQHLQRADALQLALPHAGRAGEDRRLRGRRLSARVPGDVARRDAAAAHRDAVPQPRQHGRRGEHPRQPDRRRGAADGLRQDHAGAADGRRRAPTCPPSACRAGRCSTASGAARSSARAPACGA